MTRPWHALELRLRTAQRAIRRYGFDPRRLVGRLDERAVFVVGSPRSGTSFTAAAIGRVDGFADLGEVRALKAAIPALCQLPRPAAVKRLRRLLDSAQRLGMVTGLRPIEQTPESTFLMPVIAAAYPEARFVHLVRDGRDAACSLIERGWLRDGAPGVAARATGTVVDDAGNPYGDYTRFWVEPDRAQEFRTVSEARRAGWAWRRYTEAALEHGQDLGPERVLRIGYERLVTAPAAVAAELAAFLDAADLAPQFEAALAGVHDRSLERWRHELTPEQLADVEAEVTPLLAELGYEPAS